MVTCDVIGDQQSRQENRVKRGKEQQLHRFIPVEPDQEDQKRVLQAHKHRLPINHERIPRPPIIRKSNSSRNQLQNLTNQTQPRDALAQQNLEELGQFDEGGAADNADGEALAEEQLGACRIGGG